MFIVFFLSFRQDLLKWNGWGYRDTKFGFDDYPNSNVCQVTGDRYKISGHKLPVLFDWFKNVIGANLDRKSNPQPEMTADQIPNAIINDGFMIELKKTSISFSDDPQDRLFRAHGKYSRIKLKQLNVKSYLLDIKAIPWTSCLY